MYVSLDLKLNCTAREHLKIFRWSSVSQPLGKSETWMAAPRQSDGRLHSDFPSLSTASSRALRCQRLILLKNCTCCALLRQLSAHIHCIASSRQLIRQAVNFRVSLGDLLMLSPLLLAATTVRACGDNAHSSCQLLRRTFQANWRSNQVPLNKPQVLRRG